MLGKPVAPVSQLFCMLCKFEGIAQCDGGTGAFGNGRKVEYGKGSHDTESGYSTLKRYCTAASRLNGRACCGVTGARPAGSPHRRRGGRPPGRVRFTPAAGKASYHQCFFSAFLSRLASFFSFGVLVGSFFTFFFASWLLPMMFSFKKYSVRCCRARKNAGPIADDGAW